MIDIVLPLGDGSPCKNRELRYALRSIVRYATGWRRIWIVGCDPGFLSDDPRVQMVPVEEANGNKEYRIAAKFLHVFRHTDCLDYIAAWNDDYVLTREVYLPDLDFWHRGSLAEAAERHQGGRYKRALQLTSDLLRSAGKPELHYDIHLPIIYQRQLFLGLEKWWEASRQSPCGMVVKSIYANNVLPEPGPKVDDCKLRRCPSIDYIRNRIEGRWCYSYSDDAMASFLDRHLRREYPDRCPLER